MHWGPKSWHATTTYTGQRRRHTIGETHRMDIASGQFEDAAEDLIVATEHASKPQELIPHQATPTLTTNGLIYDIEAEVSEDELDASIDNEHQQDDDFFEQDLDVVNGQDWETLAGAHQLLVCRLVKMPYPDLTRRYNRLRQTVTFTTQNRHSQQTATTPAVLPATNQKRTTTVLDTLTVTPHSTVIQKDKVNDQSISLTSKFANKLSLGEVNTTSTRKGGFERLNHTNQADRATNKQVLNPRPRLVLFKMLGRGLVDRIEGCISTGKEANVYHAITLVDPFTAAPSESDISLAMKICKTIWSSKIEINTFRLGYAKQNPQKMVKLWAEKEMRNLKRLIMYHQCKLVHANSSEYNILYHDDHLFITDSISILHTKEELIELVQKLISSPQPQSVQDGAKTVELTHEASKSTKILDHERSEENNTNEAVF
ncbi:hypothetical protein PSTT_11356 [Puccinia striiformis]|uniref:non-specific serine/threonine protein kinase n=1 Tax=Puccinia striiformis TaxID=27350 RepID=A0A2S4V0S6_9BASI|nr:hypothetical protein PSTT_11356 [Puccinia striiformis]